MMMKISTLVYLWLIGAAYVLTCVVCENHSVEDIQHESDKGSGEEGDLHPLTNKPTSVSDKSDDESTDATAREDEVKDESESESKDKPSDLITEDERPYSDDKEDDDKEDDEEEDEEDEAREGLIFLTGKIKEASTTPPERIEEESGDGEQEETSKDEKEEHGDKSSESEDDNGKQDDDADAGEETSQNENENDEEEKNEKLPKLKHGKEKQVDDYDGSGEDDAAVTQKVPDTGRESRKPNEQEKDEKKEEKNNGVQDDAQAKEGESNNAHEYTWRYYGTHGPGNWSREFSSCKNGESNQSPINLDSEEAEFDDQQAKISLMVEQQDGHNTNLINTGRTVKVVFNKMIIRVLGLANNIYRVSEMIFHWGNTEETGSEHTMEGKRFPLEMQLTSYDEEQFNAIEESEIEASNSSKGLLNLAVLFKVSAEDNSIFNPIINQLDSIQTPGENVSITSFEVQNILPEKTEFFYRYSGSMTSPPCSEGVDWIVFQGLQTISPSQLKRFRNLKEEVSSDGNHTLLDFNWRPIQPRNHRAVKRSFPISNLTPIPPNTPTPIPSKTEPHTGLASKNPTPNISFVLLFLCTWKMLLS